MPFHYLKLTNFEKQDHQQRNRKPNFIAKQKLVNLIDDVFINILIINKTQAFLKKKK